MKILRNRRRLSRPFLKFDLKMRLTTLLLFTVLIGLHANNGYSQRTKITLTMDDSSLSQVIDEIEATTDFRFVYRNSQVDVGRKVSVNVKKARITEVLELLFGNTAIDYSIREKQIHLKIRSNPSKNIPKQQASVRQDPIQVSGKVADVNGVPMSAVSVVIKGTSRGVATDFDGNYQITVPNSQSVLVFTNIGFAEKEITVGNQTIINVTMEEAVSQLDEVVLNAGYYKTEKKVATGNIAKVTSEAIGKQPITTPLQALSGRMAGVQITQQTGLAGGGVEIQIRGRNSIRDDGNAPLFIVDGVPIPSVTLLSPLGGGGDIFRSSLAPINNFNPSDIESIEVLKDADATAIYGSRGANGVVLITTKKGISGKTVFNINHSAGLGEVSNKLDLLNTEQYLEMRREAVKNDGLEAFLENPNFDSFWPDIKLWDSTRYTDWQEELLGGTAEFYNSQVSLSGGNDNLQFLLSGTLLSQSTVFPGDYKTTRGSGLLSLNYLSDNKRLSVSTVINFMAEKNNLPGGDLTFQAIGLAPNTPEPFDDLGNLNFEDNTFPNNPYVTLQRPYEAKRRNLNVSSQIDYSIIPELSLKMNLGYNYTTIDELRKIPLSTLAPNIRRFGGSVRSSNGTIETWIIEPQAEFKKDLGPGKLIFLVGGAFQYTFNERETLFAQGYTSDALLGNINSAPTIIAQPLVFSEYKYNALFGRINYNLLNKYIVNITGRRDGSSRFGPGKQFGNFGSIGAAWIFSNELFFKNNAPFISFGKLRTSYGTTGSDQIGNYRYFETYQSSDNPYLGTVGLTPTRLPNNDFSWETNRKFEAGIELGFWKNRISLSSSYYQNRSSNQLVGIPLAATTAFSSVIANWPATVENTGWEFEVSSSNIKSSDFNWNTAFNLTIPRNELIEFPDLEGSSFANELTIGESLETDRALRSLGVNPETGVYVFEDQNGDGAINLEDRLPIREIRQDFFGGITNSISYKGIQLDFTFQFVKQSAPSYQVSFGRPGTASNQPIQVLERWQEPGDITNIQRYSLGVDPLANSGYANYSFNSDGSIVDASFIRLQNASLSYSVSKEVIDKIKVFDNLRIYIQGQNLLTITNYLGLDPETPTSQVLPPLRTITAGIDIGF